MLIAVLTLLAAENWTGFRGALGNSNTAAAKLPLTWSHDQNIAWRVDVPGVGQSTPVVYEGKIYLTSVEGPKKEKLNVMALDGATGKLLWKQQMRSSRPHPMGDRVSRAAPTPTIENGRIYALFDSGDLFALTDRGEKLWHVDFNERYGVIQGGHDFGSSVRLGSGGRLFAHVSQAKPSYLVALNAANGEALWKNEMPQEGGYGTPVLARQGDVEQLLVSSQGGMMAFDPATGKELWKQVREGVRGGGIPSLSVAPSGIAVAASADKGRSFAVRLSDPTKPAWNADNAVTQYSSPLIHDGRVYFVNAVGVLFVVDLETGKQLSNQRLPGSCWASALAAGDKLYFFTTEGATVVLKSGARPEKLAENMLPVSGTVYSAAPMDGALLIRTGGELWKVADVGKVPSFGAPEVSSNPVPLQAPPANAKPGDVWTNPRDLQQYVLLPTAKFTMGCPQGKCLPEEAPEREAEIAKPLWMGRNEVPVAAYRTFASQTGTRMPEEPMLLDRSLNPRWKDSKLPVLNMTATQAEAYCAWIGGRLPSEMEFEYAARASGGSDWTAENAGVNPLEVKERRGVEEKLYENGNAPHSVATKEPNALGLYDLLGNASEWTSGMFNDMPPVIRGGPPSAPDTPFRVSRGGSFATPKDRAKPTAEMRRSDSGV